MRTRSTFKLELLRNLDMGKIPYEMEIVDANEQHELITFTNTTIRINLYKDNVSFSVWRLRSSITYSTMERVTYSHGLLLMINIFTSNLDNNMSFMLDKEGNKC